MDPRLKLVTSPSELSPMNQGMSNWRYEEIAPRPISYGSDAFFSSEIRFPYQNSGAVRSFESMSYFKFIIELGKGDDLLTPLSEADQLAPTLNCCANLFQKAEWLAGGQTISQVHSHLPEISTLMDRMTLSKAQLDSSAASLFFMDKYFETRQAKVINSTLPDQNSVLRAAGKAYQLANIDPTADTLAYATGTGTFTYVDAAGGDLDLTNYYSVGDYIQVSSVTAGGTFSTTRVVARVTAVTALTLVIGENPQLASDIAPAVGNNGNFNIRKYERGYNAKTISVIWTPPLGIFNYDVGTPAGSYEIVLTPQNVATAKAAFIQSLGFSSVTIPTNFNLRVQDCKLYLARANAPFVKDSTVLLDLVETFAQAQTIVGDTTSLLQYNFDVSPTTQALTLALQDGRHLADTRFPTTEFKIGGDKSELQLNQYYVTYSGETRPQRIPNIIYEVDNGIVQRDTFPEQYKQTMEQVRSIISPGACESFDDWRERGQYYHLVFPRSAEDRATQVSAYLRFNTQVSNGNLLLFSHAKKVATLSIRDSRIERVSVDYV